LHADSHDFQSQTQDNGEIAARIFATSFGHLSIVAAWLSALFFAGGRFSNYEMWLVDPARVKPAAQIVYGSKALLQSWLRLGAIRYHYPRVAKNLDPGLSSLLLSGGTLSDVFTLNWTGLSGFYPVWEAATRDQSRIPGNGVNHHWAPADSIPGLPLLRTVLDVQLHLRRHSPLSLELWTDPWLWPSSQVIQSYGSRAWSLPGLERVLAHRHSVIVHLNWVSIFLGFHAFGMYIHNDTLLALGRHGSVRGHRNPVPAGHRSSGASTPRLRGIR
jgi:Photosystem I psaA/psaB protein